MKSNKLIVTALIAGGMLSGAPLIAQPKAVDVQSAWKAYALPKATNYSVFFNPSGQGVSLPILWGFDTAWNSRDNMLRGVRFATPGTISCARVSFQPWAEITEKGVLPQSLQKNLDARMQTVGLIGKKVDIVLNLDGGDPTIKEIYGGWKYENPEDPWWSPKEYIGNVVEQGPKWADLIDATAAAVEAKGYKVITASPLNEPDLELNGTPIDLFYEISKNLKDFTRYPRFENIRISGGNTLNNDEAMKWYEHNKEFLDEGNTHQLAGSFDTYAEFFTKVREDGRHATADELHNVMEAMVGVEYGMQTGIWWGTAEQARGEFMKASFGERLGYAENRDAWSAASVYRAPDGKLQGFLGCSERQAKPSSYKFVSLGGDVFIDGYGPLREYTVDLPGDPTGAYQSALQRNAETVVAIETGDDVRPVINGEYAIVNKGSRLALGARGGNTANMTPLEQQSYAGATHQLWNVTPLPYDKGGDFSYFWIANSTDGQRIDDLNYSLDADGMMICYASGDGANQQWAFEYDGDGWFHIRNKHSALYLECIGGEGGTLIQKERADNASQMWRLLPAGATLEFDAPVAPAGLKVTPRSASALLEWEPVADSGDVTYTVLRAGKGSDVYNTIARGLTLTSFLDNTVTEKEYSYKVFAMDASGNRSAASIPVSCETIGEKGLIAHLPFTENLTDISGNDFSAKTNSTPSFRDNSLYMRGEYYQLPYSLLCNEDFTIMMRAIRTSAVDGLTLFSTGIGEESYMDLSLSNGGQLTLTASNGRNKDMIYTTEAPYRTSVHVAIAVEKGKVTLYVDGKAVGTGLDGYVPSERLLSYIGRGQKMTNNNFVGLLSDFRVYNHALSAYEIEVIAAAVSGVEGIMSASPSIVAVEYYTPQGTRLTEQADYGITIIRTRYSDGSVTTSKVVK